MIQKNNILSFKSYFMFLLVALLIALQLSCTALSAQTAPEDIVISINDGYLTINGVQADMPEPMEWWVEQLGPYTRSDGGNEPFAFYVWDDLGISLSRNANGQIRNIVIEFKETDFELSLKDSGKISYGCNANENFPGTFLFNGIELDETVPLYEYNHKYRQLGGKNRHFYESSRSIVYRFTGLMFPGTKKTFGVSARVGSDNCIYRLEFSYGEWDRWPTESERERFSTR